MSDRQRRTPGTSYRIPRQPGEAPVRLVRRARGESPLRKEKPPEEPEEKKIKVWPFIALGVLVVLIIAVVLIILSGGRGGTGTPISTAGGGPPGPAQGPVTFRFLPVQERPEKRWGGFRTLVGDVNGDGRADLIWNETAETNRVYVGLGQPDGTFEFLQAQDRTERRWGGFRTLTGDVNGDGRTDLIWNETAETNRVYVGLGQPDGSLQFLPAQDHPDKGWSNFRTLADDVNGDKRTDLIWNATQDTNCLYVALGQTDGTFQFLPPQERPEKHWSGFQTLTGDVNGDGRADLVWNELAETNRIYIGLGRPDGTFEFLGPWDHPDKGWDGFKTWVGDVNGDGRSDLIWNATTETNRVSVGLGQPDGSFQFLPAQANPEEGWTSLPTLTGDVNGDKRTDLIWNALQDTNRIYIALGQPDGSFQFLPAQEHPEKGWGDWGTLLGDVNGDGRTDLIWNAKTETNRIFVALSGQ